MVRGRASVSIYVIWVISGLPGRTGRSRPTGSRCSISSQRPGRSRWRYRGEPLPRRPATKRRRRPTSSLISTQVILLYIHTREVSASARGSDRIPEVSFIIIIFFCARSVTEIGQGVTVIFLRGRHLVERRLCSSSFFFLSFLLFNCDVVPGIAVMI